MRTGISVGDLMTRNFVYVSLDTNLKNCAETMVKKRVGSLIVKERNVLKGILTEKDIIWALVKKSSKHLEKMGLRDIVAKDLMKRKVITILPSVDVSDALQKMKKYNVRRLPVVESGKVIGMLTLNDILKVDPGLFELIAENVKIREESEKLKRGGRIMAERKQGVCEECGTSEILYNDEGSWVCIACYSAK